MARVIEQLIEDASQAGPDGAEQVRKTAVNNLRQLPDVHDFIDGVYRAGFVFHSESQNFFHDDDADFSVRYVQRDLGNSGNTWRLQDDQDRALQIIESEKDEHMNIEGLAGSGKTFLTSALGEILSPKTTLLVATTPFQLKALEERLPGFAGSTFAALVRNAYANAHGVSPHKLGQRYSPKFNRRWSEISAHMGFPEIKNQTPERVAQLAADLVRKFCYGKSEHFDLKLLPRKLLSLFPTVAERWALVHAAQALWEAIMRPPQAFSDLPVRSYHLMKWLDLNDGSLDAGDVTHLIFDEGHDVPPAMLRLIDSSTLTAISLGDRFQYLGTGDPGRRAQKVRPHTFQHSVRTGFNVSDLLNTVLEYHPKYEGSIFIGNPEKRTQQRRYARLDQSTLTHVATLKGKTAILSGRIWSVFSIVQRLASAGIPFRLMTPPSKLRGAIDGALKIYNGKAHLNTDVHTFNCNNWQALRKQEGVIVDSLYQAFERGFQKADLETSLSKAFSDRPQAIRVGLVEEAKNREFDNVVLTSDISYGDYKTPHTRSKIISSLYTGITRSVHTVYYQEDMIDKVVSSIKQATSKD
ncbi:hypothetical protein MLC59_17895 [Marinobacter bryozoorum]|nr:hypothetical protein [Marinobacter bryozoorum]